MNSLSVLVAPDSFKGSLSAARVARAIAAGWRSVRPGDSVSVIPLADGGEGTLDAIEAASPDSVRRDAGLVTGPDRNAVRGEWLELPGQIAVIELAQMSGLPLMRTMDALGASTFGLGQVIAHALDHGMQQLIIGLGGSASTDGGAGALAALGLRGTGASTVSVNLAAGGAALGTLTSLDLSGLRPPPSGGVILLTDVSATLLGSAGAAAVFGPQKGADAAQIVQLAHGLRTFAHVLDAACSASGSTSSRPGSGAAGGTAYGFSTVWRATIVPGADYISALSGADAEARAADVVLTGEGRFDETSMTGKLVGSLIAVACSSPARIGVIAGQVSSPPQSPDGAALWSCALVDLAGSTAEALAEPERWLRMAGARAALALTAG